jgi:acetyltransferase-like isoleucine patch superfamily enzyme
MIVLCRGIKRILNDLKCDEPRAVLFLWFANVVPDLYIFKLVKSICLKAAGVHTGIDNVYFKSKIAVDSPRSLTIGRGVFINRDVIFEGTGCVSIRGNCQIGPNVVFATTSHDIENKMSASAGDILVEENVWIGAGVIVLKNIQLGPNVVVAAGSVVNKSFSNCVIAGVPARCVKYFDPSSSRAPIDS